MSVLDDRPKRIPPGFILPSAALTVTRRQIFGHRRVDPSGPTPAIGDVVYGEVERIGSLNSIENKNGRIHTIHPGTRAVFVYGHRYAPDVYESGLPEAPVLCVDLVARSGLIGLVTERNSTVAAPTRVKLLGRVCDEHGTPMNTRDHPLVKPRSHTKTQPRAKLILLIGTSMNSGKSVAAAACCWALTTMGHDVRGSKVTGTASLQDVLHMNDAGASIFNDFTNLGWPSTYRLEEHEVLEVFDHLDLKYANNPRNYWVVELADGILQRETAMLLSSPNVRERIHRLVFCARDGFGCVGGIHVLEDRFDLVPDAVSGIVSGSPLMLRELAGYSAVPVFDSLAPDLDVLSRLLL